LPRLVWPGVAYDDTGAGSALNGRGFGGDCAHGQTCQGGRCGVQRERSGGKHGVQVYRRSSTPRLHKAVSAGGRSCGATG